MAIVQQLRTLPLYFNYFLNVTDRHSLQAPFIFEFYSKFIQGIKNNVCIDEIEAIRKAFLKDHSKIRGIDFGAGSRITKSAGDKTVAMIAKHGISSQKDCIFLSELVKLIQPKTSIELGTSLGIATAYLSKSIRHGSICTFEGNDELVQKSSTLFRHLNCQNVQLVKGNIDEKLPSQLTQLDKVDFAIIDANHTYEALLLYFDLLKSKMSDSGVVVIDDIRWSVDMYRGWKKIISDDAVTNSIEFLNKGVLMFKKSIQRQHYILSY